MKRIMTCMLVAGLFFTSTAVQADGPDDPLTLQAAIDLACNNNALVRQARDSRLAAGQRLDSARAARLFTLSATYSYAHLRDKPYSRIGLNKAYVGDEERHHWDVTLQQPIFTGFALRGGQAIARLGLDRRVCDEHLARLDLVREVKTVYLQTLQLEKMLAVAADSVESLEAHARDTELFHRTGMIPYNDLLKARVALADQLQNRRRLQADLALSRALLNTLVARDLPAKTRLEEVLLPVHETPELEELLRLACRQRPELQLLRLGLQQYDERIRIAKGAAWPTLAVYGQYARNGEDLFARTNDYANEDQAALGLEASWKFFEWGRKRFDTNALRLERSALLAQLESIENRIRVETRQAQLDLAVAQSNIQTAARALEQARENWRITNLQYRRHVATTTDVLDARTYLTRAETNHHQAHYGYLLALAALDRATAAESPVINED